MKTLKKHTNTIQLHYITLLFPLQLQSSYTLTLTLKIYDHNRNIPYVYKRKEKSKYMCYRRTKEKCPHIVIGKIRTCIYLNMLENTYNSISQCFVFRNQMMTHIFPIKHVLLLLLLLLSADRSCTTYSARIILLFFF
jgi:hypothetical protein